MTRHYLRLDPAFDERKESYPDGPYAALIAAFCLAESQPERGRFRSERYLRALMGKRGRHIGYLIAHNDLIVLPDGRLYVDGWDEWQEGDWKVAERVERIRNRVRRNASGNGRRNGSSNASPSDGNSLDSGALRSGALQSGAHTAGRSPDPEKHGSKNETDEERLARYRSVLVNPSEHPTWLVEAARAEVGRHN